MYRSSNPKCDFGMYNLRRMIMKTIVCRSMAAALLCVFALGVSAQDVLKVKVMNIPSAVGKIMIATDKGSMVCRCQGHGGVLELKDVTVGKYKLYVYHDENNNYQLDREDGIPSEYCAIADVEVSADTKQVEIALKRVLKGSNK